MTDAASFGTTLRTFAAAVVALVTGIVAGLTAALLLLWDPDGPRAMEWALAAVVLAGMPALFVPAAAPRLGASRRMLTIASVALAAAVCVAAAAFASAL
jgi:hypothetical protein